MKAYLKLLEIAGMRIHGLDGDGDPDPYIPTCNYGTDLSRVYPDRPDIWCIAPLRGGCGTCTACYIHCSNSADFKMHYQIFLDRHPKGTVHESNMYAFEMVYNN